MVLVWGFSFVAIRVGLDYVSPDQLIVLRFLPTLFFFIPLTIHRLNRHKNILKPRDYLVLLVLGAFAVIGYNLALNTGQTKIPASLAALVIALNPTSIAIFAIIALKEKPSIKTWFGLVLGLSGIMVVIFGRGMAPELRIQTIIGVIITLGAPLSWGIYSTGLRFYTPRLGSVLTTSITMSIGSIPLLFMINRPLIERIENPPLLLTVSVLFLAIGCTVFGFTGWAKVLGRIEAAKAGVFIYLVPIVAAFGSHILLHEPIDLPLVAGTLIVLTGVSVTTGHLSISRIKSLYNKITK